MISKYKQKTNVKKILVLRLSSIGDVLLTTPVVRCLKHQLPHTEIHFVTKPGAALLMEHNPNVDRLLVLGASDEELVATLRNERYDFIVDLHNNHRTRRIRHALGLPCSVYRKENAHKFLYVMSKRDVMSGRHVVDRYFDAVASLGVTDDGGGLDCYLPPAVQEELQPFEPAGPYAVIACGAQHLTKQIPVEGLLQLCQHVRMPVLLLGDKRDAERIRNLIPRLGPHVVNLCGETSLPVSAALVRDAACVVTPDSAMMHIAAAFCRPVCAVWGATVPSFGFSAFRTPHIDSEVRPLWCRPCSRMGGERCPLGHFRCMNGQDWQAIADWVNELMTK